MGKERECIKQVICSFIDFIEEKVFVKHAVKSKENMVIKGWKKKWDADDFQLEGEYHAIDKSKESSCFSGWLISTMRFFNRRIAVNKFKNFIMKFISLIMPAVMAVFICMVLQEKLDITIIPAKEESGEIKNWIVFLVVVFFPSYIISKWINVKKYQETWARHTKTKGLILCEMVKYIYQIDEYNSVLCKMRFIRNILAITNGNINKFNDNMTNKEKEAFPLSEISNFISNKSSS